MQITIRRATAHDVQNIKRVLALAHWENTRLGYIFPAPHIKLSRLREKIKKERYYVLVLKRKIMGTVAIRPRKRGWKSDL